MGIFKNFIFIVVSLIILFCIMVTGCSKPPVEKVDKLNHEMNNLNKKTAQYFAPEEYNTLDRQMNEMQRCMEQKKYKLASVLADSAMTMIDTVQSILATKGRATATESLDNVKLKMEKLNELINSDTFKEIRPDRRGIFTEKQGLYSQNIATLEVDLDSTFFLRVHRNSKKLSDEIETTIQRLSKNLERTVSSRKMGTTKRSNP